MLGISGSHGCGKSSLAKAYAEKHGIEFIPTTASGVFKRLGVDPAAPMDFGTRLMVQQEILKEFDAIYASCACKPAITDRTPLDLLGYTMAECIGHSVSEEHHPALRRYINDCFEVLNKRFFMLVVVQPGIAVAPGREGKAASNEAYIEHLSSLILGLSVDERLKVPSLYLPRRMTDFDERLLALGNSEKRIKGRIEREYAEAFEIGKIVRH